MVGGSRDSAVQILDKGTHVETLTVDQQNYKAYVADRVKHGWSVADVAEYKEAVGDLMTTGTDDEKAAASEFWALKVDCNAAHGINQRIRQSLAADPLRRVAA